MGRVVVIVVGSLQIVDGDQVDFLERASDNKLQLEHPKVKDQLVYTRATACSQSTAQSYTTSIPSYWSAEQLRDGPLEHVDPA